MVWIRYSGNKGNNMDKISKPNGKSQALLREGVEFQSAMQKAGLAELTQITL